MSFADNLRKVRKDKNISQEELAEILNVSRQAISKWEQGVGYPEAEKLIVIARELNTSLDFLMCDEVAKSNPYEAQIQQAKSTNGTITVRSFDGKALVNCHRVFVYPLFNRLFKKKPGQPQYALFGEGEKGFFDENRHILGYYLDEESVNKEQDAIMEALSNGAVTYQLQYAAKVKVKKNFTRFLSIK